MEAARTTLTEPVDVVREIFRCFAEGDDPFPLIDENVVWNVPMVDGTYHGHRGVGEFFRHWIGTWDDYRITLEQIMPTPDGRVLAVEATLHTDRRQLGLHAALRQYGEWAYPELACSWYLILDISLGALR